MGASFDHEEGGEWEVVEDLEYDLCGSFETSLSLSAQKHGTRPLSRHNSGALSNTKSQASRDFSIRPQFYASVVSFEMAPNLTAEQVDEAREHNRMAARAKSLAWAFGGVHKSDKHREASSMPGNSASHEYAEDDRERLRAEYLAWMFGGVHINNAHEDWDNLSAKDKEALKAKLAQGRSDEQVGREEKKIFWYRMELTLLPDERDVARDQDQIVLCHNEKGRQRAGAGHRGQWFGVQLDLKRTDGTVWSELQTRFRNKQHHAHWREILRGQVCRGLLDWKKLAEWDGPILYRARKDAHRYGGRV